MTGWHTHKSITLLHTNNEKRKFERQCQLKLLKGTT